MKTFSTSFGVLIATILLILACSKWDLERIDFMQVITVGVIEVGASSAFLIGDIEGLRGGDVTETGFVYSSTARNEATLQLGNNNVGSKTSLRSDTTADRAFAVRVDGLEPNTSYSFRAYIKLAGIQEAIYGGIDLFTTRGLHISIESFNRESQQCPAIVTFTLLSGGFDNEEGGNVGIAWSDDLNNKTPAIHNSNVQLGQNPNSEGKLKISIAFVCDNTYFIRAFGTSKAESIYSDVIEFSLVKGGQWIQTTSFPSDPRIAQVSFSIGSTGYVGYGQKVGSLNCNDVLSDFWEFNSQTEGWQEIQSTPTTPSPRSWALGFSGSGKGFLGLGCNMECNASIGSQGTLRDFYEFDPTSKGWTRLGEYPGIGEMPFASRLGAFSFLINEEVYVGLGWQCSIDLGSGITDSDLGFILFDPKEGQWNFAQIGVLEHRYLPLPVSFTINDIAYFGLLNSDQVNNTLFFTFNPVSMSGWETLEHPFPGPARESAVAFSIGTKGFAGLGFSSESGRNPLNDFYEYDPGSSWRVISEFPGEGRKNAISFTIGNKAYVGMGVDRQENGLTDFWQYIPELIEQQ